MGRITGPERIVPVLGFEEAKMTGIRFKKDQGERYVRVLEEVGATEQELARFAHLAKRSALGAFIATMAIKGGMPVAEAIDGCAEVERRRKHSR